MYIIYIKKGYILLRKGFKILTFFSFYNLYYYLKENKINFKKVKFSNRLNLKDFFDNFITFDNDYRKDLKI